MSNLNDSPNVGCKLREWELRQGRTVAEFPALDRKTFAIALVIALIGYAASVIWPMPFGG